MLIALILLALYMSILTLKCGLALIALRTTQTRGGGVDDAIASQITVAQPILSGDPNLPIVLRRQLEGLPPEVEFIWLIDEADTEGRRIATELAAEFKQVHVEYCPPCAIDENPKTFKLSRALNKCRRRWFVVLDDDTEIAKESLVVAVESLAESQLYTGLPAYSVPDSGWGRLVAHFVNSHSILTYLPPLVFAEPMSLNGMFYVVETERLRSVGGFDPLLHELCDDYALHRYVTKQGWKVTQGATFQRVSTSVDSFRSYWRLMHRWLVFSLLLTRDQALSRKIYLVTMLALPPLLLLVAVPLSLVHPISALVMACALVVRHSLLRGMQVVAGMPLERFGFGLSLCAELFQPFQMASALWDSSIVWRGQRIRLRGGFRFELCSETP
ncbi:MAG: glycosyltransferase [Planctomycetota bacterium]